MAVPKQTVKTRNRSYKRVLTWFASRRPQTPAQASQEASLEIQRPQGAVRAEIGRQRGDAMPEDNKRRLSLLPLTLPSKPKGLRREKADGRLSGRADKNASALRRKDQPSG